jgi:hypothetical protein
MTAMIFDETCSNLVLNNLQNLPTQVSASWKGMRHSLLFLLLLMLAPALLAEEQSAVTLKALAPVGDLTRVQGVLELAGELKLNPDGKQVTKLSVKGTGDLVYQERIVASETTDQPGTNVRHYQKAEARFTVGEGEIATSLSEERRLIGVKTTQTQSVLFSPLGPLSKDELDLIDIQGSSAVLHRLLPDKEVQVGEQWTLSNETAAILVRLDVVTDNKLQSTLKKVEAKVAYCEMTGSVSGSTGGIASDLTLTAKYNFDLTQQRITWLAMSIHEIRAIGHAEPGFDVTARIRLEVSPLTESTELATELVATLPLTGDDASTYLTHTTSDETFRLLLPRSWRIMVDRHDVTIMRFIDRGEMIAQCNLSKLTDAAPNKHLTMESFQSEIQRTLAKNFGQMVEAKETRTDRGLRALRVVAAGTVSDLPIQWIYYHLTDEKGQQAAVVFTLDANLVERFGGEDQTVVSAFEMLPAAPSKKEATAAKPATGTVK